VGNVNIGRGIIGGVVAAIILFVVDFVVNGVILMEQWTAAMAALQRPAMGGTVGEIVLFVVLDLIIGLTAVWIYVGIRPRFGPGVKTAIYAGIATWLLACLVPNGFSAATGLFPASLLWTTIIVALIQIPVATVAGAWLYQEE
jgi:hypothetical protein